MRSGCCSCIPIRCPPISIAGSAPIAGPEAIDAYFDLYWRYLRRLSHQFDCIVSASASLSRRLTAGGVEKVATVPMGVEPGIFSPDHRDEKLRRDLLARCSLGPEGLLLLGAGRLAPEKRWPMVVDAVAAAGYSQPIGLVLVGGGRHRSRIARVMAPNPHTQLLAPISDRGAMARLMASADALVHGCEAETFCIVAAEARASGLPLIVPDAGGASDQYRPGIDQIYAAAKPAALVEAILRCAAEGPDRSGARAASAGAHDGRAFRRALPPLRAAWRRAQARRLSGPAGRSFLWISRLPA